MLIVLENMVSLMVGGGKERGREFNYFVCNHFKLVYCTYKCLVNNSTLEYNWNVK